MTDLDEELEDLEEDSPEPVKDKGGKRPRTTPSLEIDLDEFNRLVAERLKELMSDFDESTVTTTDREQLKTLAELNVLSELSNRKSALMVIGSSSPQDIKYVSDSAKSLSGEARMLATSLGIDRKSRVTEEESELEMYLPTLHKDAKEFIHKRAIAIVCPHCLGQEARIELRMGHILYAFAYELKWAFDTICPKCKREIQISQANYQKFLFSELEKAGGVQKLTKRQLEEELADDDD